MAIFIIGDLHLGFSVDKPMDVFGAHWKDHHVKIKDDWMAKVTDDDLVILAGDTSWANTFAEAKTDLDYIDKLPGTKLITKGNHDYWWTTLGKMNGVYSTLHFLHNTAFVWGDYVVVGTRGWDYPTENAQRQTKKIYDRECIRFKLSIDTAPVDKQKIGVLHYPPFGDDGKVSPLTAIIDDAQIKQVYFGHIHSGYDSIRQGKMGQTTYTLISCDYLDFKLYRIV